MPVGSWAYLHISPLPCNCQGVLAMLLQMLHTKSVAATCRSYRSTRKTAARLIPRSPRAEEFSHHLSLNFMVNLLNLTKSCDPVTFVLPPAVRAAEEHIVA